jgi:oligopeptide transport system permease protein
LSELAGRVGIGVAVIMLLACYGSVPWTFARVAATAADTTPSVLPRRFEASDADAARLPPFWTPHADDEHAALLAINNRDGAAHRYILGTDRLGRDLLARCLAGGAISLSIGIAAAFIAVCIGTLYGTIAGARSGLSDAVMMRLVDIIYGLPYILLVVLLAVAVDGVVSRIGQDLSTATRQFINVLTLAVAIGGVSWLTLARVTRGQVLSLKQQPFMEACRAIGVGPVRQFRVHLLPNLMGPITVYAALTVPTAILSESFLSFLGIGVSEPLPSWGNLAADGLNELNLVRVRWWLLLWPCLFIAMTLIALNFMGERLRQRMDIKRTARRRPSTHL